MKGYRLIVFEDGRRIEKRVPLSKLPELKIVVRKLRERGAKCAVVLTNVDYYASYIYPPEDEIEPMREQGFLWCPYCRAWRFFKIPKAYRNAEVGSREFFLNSQRNQEIAVCAWCEISVFDFYVGRANGIFAEVRSGTRRKHRRKGNRQRVSRRSI